MRNIVSLGALAAATVFSLPAQAEPTGKYFVEADLLYMTRESPDSADLIRNSGGPVILNAGAIEPDWAPGLQLQAGARVSGPIGFMIGGFFLTPIEDQLSHSQASSTAFIGTTPETTFGGLTGYDATFESEIKGAEFNITYAVANGIDVFAGARAIQLDEMLELDLPFGAGAAEGEIATWTAENWMVGPQIGTRVNLGAAMSNALPKGFFVGFQGSVGALFNNGESDFNLDRGRDGTTDVFAGNSSKNTSLFGQAALKVGYRVSEFAALAAGYQGMYLSDVAQATGQVAATDSFNADGEVGMGTATDDVWFHGGFLNFTIYLN